MTKNEAREAAFKQYRKEWFDVGVSVPSLGVDFKNGFDAGWDAQQAEIERLREALEHYADIYTWSDNKVGGFYGERAYEGHLGVEGVHGYTVAQRALKGAE